MSKKSRTYKPRRGIRFNRDRLGVSPDASFIGGGSPVEPVDVTGTLQSSVTQLNDSGSLVDRSVTFSHLDASKALNNTVLGIGASDLADPDDPSSRVPLMVRPTVTQVPSWTQFHTGKNSGFVISAISSSDHETQLLNYYRSGTFGVENTAVPASGVLHYGKRSALQTIIVKKTASFFDTIPSPLPRVFKPSQFVPGVGTSFQFVTGNAGSAQFQVSRLWQGPHAGSISLDVVQSGKLVDIKVWVELHHNSSSLTASAMPLGSLALALKHPTLTWEGGSAHPLWNNPMIRSQVFLNSVPEEIFQNTFLLWEGLGSFSPSQRAYEADPSWDVSQSPNSVRREMYPCWDRDFSMRAIFCDSGDPNPRHHYGPLSGNFIGAPNAALGINSAWGAATYWTASTGSPPRGWLTGPGGSANVNEWPTTGSNLGSVYLRPVYPLLDAIQVTKTASANFLLDPINPIAFPTVSPTQLKGFRPGLRGTEISGSWQLLFFYSLPSGSGVHVANHELFFRQARLELTYEEWQAPTKIRNDSRRPRRNRSARIMSLSGTAVMVDPTGVGTLSIFDIYPWDYYTNHIENVADGGGEIGCTFGIQLNTGSFNRNECALVYGLSGALASISGTAPGWLLNNEFGMPRIPLASASLAEYVPNVPSEQRSVLAVLSQPKVLDGPRRLADVARAVNPPQTLVDLAADFVSGSAI
jgi:hypothetical protein